MHRQTPPPTVPVNILVPPGGCREEVNYMHTEAAQGFLDGGLHEITEKRHTPNTERTFKSQEITFTCTYFQKKFNKNCFYFPFCSFYPTVSMSFDPFQHPERMSTIPLSVTVDYTSKCQTVNALARKTAATDIRWSEMY